MNQSINCPTQTPARRTSGLTRLILLFSSAAKTERGIYSPAFTNAHNASMSVFLQLFPPPMSTPSPPSVNLGFLAMNTSNAVFVHTSDGMPQLWCRARTKVLRELAVTYRRLQVQQVCTKWASTISFVAKKMVSPVIMSIFKDTQRRESMHVHFLKVDSPKKISTVSDERSAAMAKDFPVIRILD
ncbi:unannotated protein [freshwater metagenome]|uniref:Unannotated protein n=1 Tax=freshwater metagenome TaxID=449393 RepID=A0A6J6DLL7_9ZZZZ